MPVRKTCNEWSQDACIIEEVRFEHLRDFFRVRGRATNVMDCILPHLRLRVTVLDLKGKIVADNIIHITDRRLQPKESSEFKIEGEWKRGMSKAKVTVEPHPKEGAR